MYKEIDKEVAQAVGRIKKNPVHMERLCRRFKQNRAKQQSVSRVVNGKTCHARQENSYFSDNEDITVYVDFCSDRYFVKTDPIDVRRKQAAKWLHTHEFFEMMYVYSGACYCYFGGEEFLLPKGTIWIFNTQCAHNVVVPDDGSTLVNILLRKSTFSATILNMIQGNDLFLNFFLNSIYNVNNLPHYMQFDAEPGSVIEFYLFKILLEYERSSNYNQDIMKLMLSSLLTELARDYQIRAEQKDQTASIDILNIIAYISSNYADVTLKSTAEHFHYSPDYISKCILKYTGYSFLEYMKRYKLNKAEYLLQTTDLPLDQIASMVGYHQRSSFDREFKKHFTITPGRYRTQAARQAGQ